MGNFLSGKREGGGRKREGWEGGRAYFRLGKVWER